MMAMQGLRIMVVDDEPIVCKRLRSALEKNGYRVECFQNGHDAIERFRESAFDIVVSDIRMGDMDGLQVLDEVQAVSERAKVIMISGYATLEVARAALAKGAFDCIAKPFQPNELRAVIEKAAKELENFEHRVAE